VVNLGQGTGHPPLVGLCLAEGGKSLSVPSVQARGKLLAEGRGLSSPLLGKDDSPIAKQSLSCLPHPLCPRKNPRFFREEMVRGAAPL